jgi:hypothetical protein
MANATKHPRAVSRNLYDVSVYDHGSIVMVCPRTKAADKWIEENVALESWQWFGGGFAVEPRYLENLMAGMLCSGLIVG